MNPSLRRRSGVLFLGASLLLITSGCGITDYENRMGSEQARLDHFDRENQFLEGPMKWPEKKEEKKDEKAPEGIQPAEVFFRPPKGIVTTPQAAGGQVLRLPAAQPGPQAIFQDVLVLVVRGKGREAFQPEALQAFGMSGSPAEKKVLTVPGRPPMGFEYHRNEQGSVQVHLYLYGEENYQAAIAFRVTKPDLAAIDVSLGTLYFGSEALKQHRTFGQRRTAGK